MPTVTTPFSEIAKNAKSKLKAWGLPHTWLDCLINNKKLNIKIIRPTIEQNHKMPHHFKMNWVFEKGEGKITFNMDYFGVARKPGRGGPIHTAHVSFQHFTGYDWAMLIQALFWAWTVYCNPKVWKKTKKGMQTGITTSLMRLIYYIGSINQYHKYYTAAVKHGSKKEASRMKNNLRYYLSELNRYSKNMSKHPHAMILEWLNSMLGGNSKYHFNRRSPVKHIEKKKTKEKKKAVKRR